MEPATNSFHNPMERESVRSTPEPMNAAPSRRQGVRTQVLLILAMSVITAGATLVSLLAIRKPLQNLIAQNLSADLRNSLATFETMQAQHLAALDRENALLADLPTLKALMTTNDERTIADAGVEFWKTSGNDLFALVDRNSDIMAAFVSGGTVDQAFRANLHAFLSAQQGTYFVSGNRLFECS